MSEIRFAAELDTAKLDAAVKASNQTVGEWAKNVEKSGEIADKGLSRMTKSFKEAIKDQKDLIKAIESDVKNLQKAFDNATAGKAKQMAYNELRSAKKALAEEQATLLGLQEQQIAANNKVEGSQSKIITSLKSWGLGLVSVGAALKIAKGIIDSTEVSARNFEKVVASATAGVNYFFKAIATGDWSNFFEGLSKAIKGAADFVDEMDRINNRQNEQKIRSAELDEQISQLRQDTYDKDEGNNQKRLDSLTKIVDLQKQKYTEESELMRRTYETNLRKASTDSGLSEDMIRNFIREYSSLENLVELGTKYNDVIAKIRQAYRANVKAEDMKPLFDQRDALGESAVEAGKYAAQISKVTTETRNQLAEYEASAIKARAAFGERDRRDKMQLAEVQNRIKTDAETKRKQAEEDVKLQNQLKKQQELFDKAVQEGNEKQIKAIADRINILEKEIEAREKLKRQILDAAQYEGFAPSQIAIARGDEFKFGSSSSFVLPTKPKPKPKSWVEQGAEMDALRTVDIKKKEAEIEKTIHENLERQAEVRQQIIGLVADLTYELTEQLGLSEEAADFLNTSLTALTQLASGDYAGAALSMISNRITLITNLIELIPTEASKFESQIQRINALLEEQQRLIERSKRTGGEGDLRKEELEMLKKREEAQKAEYERLQSSADRHLDLLGWRQKKADEAYQAWQDTVDVIEDANIALEDFYTGSIHPGVIVDAISQGFQEGKSAAADFADTFNDFMRQAINSALEEMARPEVARWYAQFAEYMASDGGLSDEERAKLKEDWDKIITDNAKRREEAYRIAGISPTSETATGGRLSGQIQRTITEDTGTMLAGLMRKISDDNRMNRDYNKQSVEYLASAVANLENIKSLLAGEPLSLISPEPMVPVVNIEMPVVDVEIPETEQQQETTSEIITEIRIAAASLEDIYSIQEVIAQRLKEGLPERETVSPDTAQVGAPDVNIINTQVIRAEGEKTEIEADIGELALLMRKFSDDGRLTRDYSREGVEHLAAVEYNTSQTVTELKKTNENLEETNKKLGDVVTNTKPTYSGLGE